MKKRRECISLGEKGLRYKELEDLKVGIRMQEYGRKCCSIRRILVSIICKLNMGDWTKFRNWVMCVDIC